jgi:hypothetical protein
MAGVLPGSAQSFLHYLPIDSARQIIEVRLLMENLKNNTNHQHENIINCIIY